MDKPSTIILTKAYIEANTPGESGHEDVDLLTGKKYNPKKIKITLENLKDERVDKGILIYGILEELDRMAEKINEK